MEFDQRSLYVPDNTVTTPCRCSTDSPLPQAPAAVAAADLEPRNLVVCIDGTSNKFGTKNTNVVELYSHILKTAKDNQLTYYDSGIGTFARPSWKSLSYLKQIANNKIDLAIAWNLEKVILGAYRWISNHYRPGDRIFLFGFSRGAYQVRILAGMIHAVGLILPGNEAQIPFAFELYSAYTSSIKLAGLAENFKKTFSQEFVRVHFLGAWDTVSSVGILRSKKVFPFVVDFCEHICIFRHALALDERRVKFLPEYIHEGASHTPDEILEYGNGIAKPQYGFLRYLLSLGRRPVKGLSPESTSQTSDKCISPKSCNSDIKEVWFAGTHSDIGGGNRDNTNLQSGDIPLLWMRNEAFQAGLRLKPTDIQWKQEDLERPPKESLEGFCWWLLEYLPLRRLSFDDAKDTTHRPHAGQTRKIVAGQKIHASVIFRPGYRPKAAHPGYPFADWPHQLDINEPASHQRLQELSELHWETDLFDLWPADLLFRGSPQDRTAHLVERVAFISSFEDGRSAIPKTDHVEAILSQLINSTDEGIKINAAVILCELGTVWKDKEEHFSEIIANGCLKTLRSMLDTTVSSNLNTRASKALPSLVKNGPLRSKIIENGLIKKLFDLLECGKPTVLASSARAVAYLVAYDDLRNHMNQIDKLEPIWTSKDDSIVMSGATILTGLTLNSRSRLALVNCNHLNKILSLVGSSKSLSTVSAYLKVLASLAGYDDTRSAILQSNFLATVSDIFSVGDPSVIPGTVETLCKLSNINFKTVCVDRLLERIKNTDKQTWSSCFNGLKLLADQDKTQEMIIQSELVDILVKKLAHRKSFADAANALSALTVHDGFRKAIIKSDFAQHLANKLAGGGAPISEILKALESFAMHEDIRTAMIDSGMMTILVNGLARRSLWGTVVAVRVIQPSLLKHDNIRTELLQRDLITALVELIKYGNIIVVHSIIHILVVLGSHEDMRDAVIKGAVVESLVDRLRSWRNFREELVNMELHGALHTIVKIKFENSKSEDTSTWFYPMIFLNSLAILFFHLVSIIKLMRYQG